MKTNEQDSVVDAIGYFWHSTLVHKKKVMNARYCKTPINQYAQQTYYANKA
jgi:hypothetical protein